jgi:two-component system LytT family response regulator
VRVLIADDEPLARERVRGLLARESDITIVAEASNGLEAVEAIRRTTPDVVFLDVQMPELDGFGVVERIGVDDIPVVIFATAYDEFALRAFEVAALDYLLKPFDPDRFHQAVERARAQLCRKDALKTELMGLLESLPAQRRFLERIVVKSGGRISFLPTEDLDCVEAYGNYVRLCAGADEHLLRMTLSALEERLDPERFVRIHRSTIVNITHVRELQSSFHGEYAVILRSGRRVTLSRGYRDKLDGLLANVPQEAGPRTPGSAGRTPERVAAPPPDPRPTC